MAYWTQKLKLPIYVWIIVAVLATYIVFDYKRDFVSNKEDTKYLTCWCRLGNCYVIPGKYYWPWAPTENYVETKLYRNQIGLIWNTYDEYEIKIAFSNTYHPFDLDPAIKVYDSKEVLMNEYSILDSVGIFDGKNHYNDSAQYYRLKYDYVYINTDQIFGVTSSRRAPPRSRGSKLGPR